MKKIVKTLLERVIIKEEITKNQLDLLEKYLDKLFEKLSLDIEFTRHFLDRVNDPRNITPITLEELALVFKDLYKKYGRRITKLDNGAEAVLNHMNTNINIPFVIDINQDGELELISKTIMRKKNFLTRTPKIQI